MDHLGANVGGAAVAALIGAFIAIGFAAPVFADKGDAAFLREGLLDGDRS